MKDNITDAAIIATWFSIPAVIGYIDEHAASVSILVGLPLMLIRIGNGILDFRNKWRKRD